MSGAVDKVILCGTANPQGGTEPYFTFYCDLVDGYRHAWLEWNKTHTRATIRRGRNFGHPPDPRCPECAGVKS